MGYETRFELNVDVGDVGDTETREQLILKIIGDLRYVCTEARYALGRDGNSGGAGKWYKYEDDLITFSKKYPYAVFDLHGEGEETSDIWHFYVKDGAYYKSEAIITFDPNPFRPTFIDPLKEIAGVIKSKALRSLTEEEIKILIGSLI